VFCSERVFHFFFLLLWFNPHRKFRKPQRKKSDQKAVSGDALVSSASVWLCGRSSEGDQYGKMVEVGNVFGFVAGNVV